MSNESYWENRKARETYEALELSEDAAKELKKVYVMASNDIAKEVQKIARRFQLKHHLTEKDAKRLLSKLKDKNDIDRLIQQLKMNPQTKDLAVELEAQAYAARIARLKATQSAVDTVTATILSRARGKVKSLLKKIGKTAYYKEIFGIQKRADAAFGIIPLDDKRVESVLKKPWSGENYSKLLWTDTEKLAQEVKEQILIQILTGKGDHDIAKGIAEKFGKGYNDARRLIRTESCYVTNQMALEAYKDTGVDKYIYLAILDLRTSKICQSLDKKTFDVDDAQPGKNFPPMHPWCRSTTMAWMPPEILKRLKQRAWDPVNGKYMTIPGDMTYKEWFDRYVKGNGKNAAETKTAPQKSRNLTREQYDRYKERLSDDFPYTYDEFIKLKSDKEKWADYKKKYKEAGKPKPEPFVDVTDEWKADEPWEEPKVTTTDTYVAPDGKQYVVDGKAVEREKRKKDEIEAAEIVSREKAAEVVFQPKVNEPEEVKSPDIKINDAPYEIKTSRGKGGHAYENIIKTAKGQANSVILNLNHSPLDTTERERQISGVLQSPYIGFLNELVILIDGKVDRVFRR